MPFPPLHFHRSELLRNLTVLVSGTVVAQLIPLALQPLLRRSFEAEVFGAYAVYVSILAIVIMATSLRYEQAIVLPEDDRIAANLVFAGLAFSFGFSVLFLLGILIFTEGILHLLNLQARYAPFLYLLPVGIFLHSAYQNLYYWLLRKKAFLAIGSNKFVRRSFEGTFQILFAHLRADFGLLYGDLIGNVANLFVFSWQSARNGLRWSLFDWALLKAALHRYSEFPKYSLVPVLLSTACYFLPPVFVNSFYGQASAGFFDLSRLLLSVPIALAGGAISGVNLNRLAEKYRSRESVKRELGFLLLGVSLVAVVEVVIVSFWGEELFTQFFGEQWRLSGEISAMLVWAYSGNFVVSSLSTLFVALHRVKVYSLWQVFYFVGIGSLVFFRQPSFEAFLRVFVGIELVGYGAAILLAFWVVWRYEAVIIECGTP